MTRVFPWRMSDSRNRATRHTSGGSGKGVLCLSAAPFCKMHDIRGPVGKLIGSFLWVFEETPGAVDNEL